MIFFLKLVWSDSFLTKFVRLGTIFVRGMFLG